MIWRVSFVFLLSSDKSFPGASIWIIGTSEIIENIFINEPGVVNLICREVTLAAKPLDRFRVDFQEPACFQDIVVIF